MPLSGIEQQVLIRAARSLYADYAIQAKYYQFTDTHQPFLQWIRTKTIQQTESEFCLYFEVTKSMEQCPSSEAALPSVIQEILRVAWKPNVHYRLHKSPPLFLKQSQMNHNSLKLISILSSHLRIDLPRGLFPSGFKTRRMYACFLFHFSPIRTHILPSLVRYDSHKNIWSGNKTLKLLTK